MKKIGLMLAIAAGASLVTVPAWAQDYDYADEEIGELEIDDDGIEAEDDDGLDVDDDDMPYTKRAAAQNEGYTAPVEEEQYDYSDTQFATDSPKFTPLGIGFSVGGGVTDFVGEADSFTDPGGSWEARAIIGTRSYIAGELAYLGTANNLDVLGVGSNAILMSNGAEGAVRVNILRDSFQPYVLGGVGWQHYNVTNTDTNTSDIRDSDDAMTVPMGVGMSYRVNHVIADLRGMYRPAFLADLTTTGGSSNTDLHALSGALSLGVEF